MVVGSIYDIIMYISNKFLQRCNGFHKLKRQMAIVYLVRLVTCSGTGMGDFCFTTAASKEGGGITGYLDPWFKSIKGTLLRGRKEVSAALVPVFTIYEIMAPVALTPMGGLKCGE